MGTAKVFYLLLTSRRKCFCVAAIGHLEEQRAWKRKRKKRAKREAFGTNMHLLQYRIVHSCGSLVNKASLISIVQCNTIASLCINMFFRISNHDALLWSGAFSIYFNVSCINMAEIDMSVKRVLLVRQAS